MKIYYPLLLILLFIDIISDNILAQSFQGPASGSVSSGIIQSTDTFFKSLPITEPKEVIGNEESIGYRSPDFFIDFGKQAPEGSNYIQGLDQNNKISKINSNSRLIKNFPGMGMTNSIPPDPNTAVGPNYIITTVNSQFAVFDKDGNMIKSIDATKWLAPAVPNPGVVTDPKVMYDHFNKRFVMVWLTINNSALQSYWTISVSQDSTPLGTWYTWALPSNMNGNIDAGNYGDYEGLGFDKDCIYITGNMWSLSGATEMYSKIRIIPKAQLYANTAGEVKWWDFWDITTPNSSTATFGIRPAIVFGTPNEYYLIFGSGDNGNAFSLFKLTNTLTIPTLSAVNISVTSYGAAPDANQLGGSTVLIDANSSRITKEPIFRDGFLWVVHSVRNPKSSLYSSIHYVKINVSSGKAVEDFVFGDPGFWHFYPSLMVDKDENMAITYSQSDTVNYIGAYYTSRLATDPVGLQPSKPLQTGKGNYVVTFTGNRNRWGDYNGIALDPVDNNNIWMFTEYAGATNKWGTWMGELRLTPSAYLYSDVSDVNFGSIEISQSSNIIPVILRNAGTANLVISDISKQSGPFSLYDNFTFPLTLGPNDSLIIHLVFAPSSVGVFQQNLTITSNDNTFQGLPLTGKAYIINRASENTLYASSGNYNNGEILTINQQTGSGSILGPSLYNEIRSVAVHPKTKIVYGLASSNINTEILRINAPQGDAYNYFTLPLLDMGAIAFDTSGTLYASSHTGVIYQIDLQTRNFTRVCSLGVKIQALTFNPQNDDLWGSPLVVLGSTKDRLYKINLTTGDTIVIGSTGLGVQTNALAFDNSGNLFGVTGPASQIDSLISIDINTAKGTKIGSIGYKNILGISFSNALTSIKGQGTQIPSAYVLSQNYPNPFNPSTTIEYSIPMASNVKITVYNILGDVVNVLSNSYREAGSYRLNWNGTDNNGNKISSGVYFYELKAESNSGQIFNQMKKMILLK
jgi:hypothetical protein